MGTLAGIAINLRAHGQGGVYIDRLNDRNRDLLSNLGLDRLFIIESGAAASPAAVPAKPLDSGEEPDKVERMQTMIEAHEALVAADGANLAKFKDVLEYLKHDLRVGE
jgi:hypothetical protein